METCSALWLLNIKFTGNNIRKLNCIIKKMTQLFKGQCCLVREPLDVLITVALQTPPLSQPSMIGWPAVSSHTNHGQPMAIFWIPLWQNLWGPPLDYTSLARGGGHLTTSFIVFLFFYIFQYYPIHIHMMTSSNGIIFSVAGPLCREFTGHRWIPLTKASTMELWYFLWSLPE